MTAVRESPLLSVDVSELLLRPGSTQEVHFRRVLPGVATQLARVEEGSELQIDLRLESLVDGIHVGGPVSGRLVLECRRCLQAVGEDFTVTVDEMCLYPGEAPSEVEDVYVLEGEDLNLEPIVRDAVVLALPLNPVCRQDCKGLCATCGADRNEVDCGHDGRVDIRWGPLVQLREGMERESMEEE